MMEDRIECRICGELIRPIAKKCRFCGEWLAGAEGPKEGGGPREHHEPPAGDQQENDEDQAEEAKEESPELGQQATRPEFKPANKRHRFPWLRFILFVAYVGIVVALVRSELAARQILRDAQAKENAQDYQPAFDSYRDIIEAFPYSFAVIETQRGLQRLLDPQGFPLPRPSWLLLVEDVLAKESNVCEVYLLSFVTWPACAVLLGLVFLTRILRPGAAFLVLLLMAAAVAGSVAQLSWYGRILSEPMAKGLMESPVIVYCASYVLLVVTALMTLTATRTRRSRRMSKMAAARDQ